ncbi:chord-domain-containing protein [Mortierella sp. GBAus27b]|nr:chord-domain-containing protein [Mortierella sp. GBAus27b]
MPTCTHRGCEKTYDEATNSDTACTFHPQGPIFHEGLKGWSCCSKRVTSFDEFLAIPGCSVGRHTEAQRQDVPFSNTEKVEVSKASSVSKDGTETYGSAPAAPAPVVAPKPAAKPSTPAPPAPVIEEEDDPSIPVAVGKICLRRGCGHGYVSEEESRGDKVNCQYHPGTPVFHEGSKGWTCCSRKVLEFDEFLKIKGCRTTNQHLFNVLKVSKENVEEKLVECRHDWYQTPTHVILTIYAKEADPKTSTVVFKEREINIDLRLKTGRFKLDLPLFQPIKHESSENSNDTSTFRIAVPKVEITMRKANGISWATLEPSEGVKSWTTFGTNGGGGTVGSQVMHLATDSPLYAKQ